MLAKRHDPFFQKFKVFIEIHNYIIIATDQKYIHKQIHSHSHSGAHRGLTFAKAARATLEAEEHYTSTHINEMEEYLGILQEKKAMIQLTLPAADDQIGTVGEALDSNEILETSLSDDDDDMEYRNDFSSFSSHNITKNINMYNSSGTESDHNSTTSDIHIHSSSSGPSSAPIARNFVREWQMNTNYDEVI